MTIIITLLYLLSFLLIWQFVGYPSLMAIVALRAKKSKPKNKDYSFQPFVSVIVPTYNEEKVIGKRIENLLALDYPKSKYEIIVVDSDSTDNTAQVVEDIIRQSSKPTLKLVREEERRGKASAINFGKAHARGDIVLITDANTLFDKDVLRELAPHFEDIKVGGVGGKYVVSNPNSALASSESFYWYIEVIMREGEAHLDSACTFHGEINAWRKNLVTVDAKMLTEDLDIAVQIKRAGYKVDYEPNAIAYEPSAITVGEQIKQRKRTSIGTIQCIFKYLNYFLLPRDLYSLLIFPSHKVLPMFSPFILLAIPNLYILAWNTKILITHFVLTLLVFMGLLVFLIYLKSKLTREEEIESSLSISSILKIVYYVVLNEYLILLAWKDFIFRKYSVLWEKAESTRV